MKRRTLCNRRVCSGFHSGSISFASKFELFQLSVLYLFVFVVNRGSGSARLVGVCGVDPEPEMREFISRERRGRESAESGAAAADGRPCMSVLKVSERQVEQASVA